jgi:hypothetical protein
MTVSAVVSPLTAEAFVIASEPPPGLGARCRTSPRGGAKGRPDPAYLYSMRRWRPPARGIMQLCRVDGWFSRGRGS